MGQIRLNGHKFEQAPGDGEGQGSLACYSPWCRKESEMTEWLNNSNKLDSAGRKKALRPPVWNLSSKTLKIIFPFDLGIPLPRAHPEEVIQNTGKVLSLHLSVTFKKVLIFGVCWVFTAAHVLSLVAVRGLLIGWPLLLQLESAWALLVVAPRHMGSSWTRDQTHVSCMGKWIPNHWTTREVLECHF